MPEAMVTILGGLPVIAKVSFSYDSFTGEHDAEVDNLYWMKKDRSKGKELPEHLFDRATANYQSASIIEQVSEQLAYEQHHREHSND